MKTQKGKEALKATIKECSPTEVANAMIELINGNIFPDREKVNQKINDNILDNFNNGSRIKNEMKLLFRGKLSPQEVKKTRITNKIKLVRTT